ncbi:hypothetical protein GCM10018781_78870 [Kitasatospora indigofera]|uniref:Nudix hydrolase domain-containing protein n=1 Tax=Kitasatospora indigofera TaxID=67307 RepID=A0A918YWP5_9ACTN|nr:NUDIX hydrolase [Kitasatospora indigofera]GHE26587.1 hypothetical protein GCM10018781_78870 [Kitasatospora indigofera]
MAAGRVDVAYTLVGTAGGERVLLVRNRDTWSLPGGRREDGKNLVEAAVRETKEEAGVIVEASTVVDVGGRRGPGAVGGGWRRLRHHPQRSPRRAVVRPGPGGSGEIA